ncbi:MAG: hypothetical protein OIF54_14960 [Cohaesibacter sp.]|nr:hypothetical protein [Cohaesibacter sp.]
MSRILSEPSSTKYKHLGTISDIGYDFANTLAQSISTAQMIVGKEFSASGFAELKDDGNNYMVGWQSEQNDLYVFGDVETDQNLDDLVCLAKRSIAPCSNSTGPQKPTAVPAFMLIVNLENEPNPTPTGRRPARRSRRRTGRSAA